MDQSIQDFVGGRRIAVIGASRGGKKFGNIALKELQARGYEVYPVHPSAAEIDGRPCCPDLAGVKDRVDGVLVSVPPAQAVRVMEDAAASGLRRVWLQPGAESPAVLELGRALGLDVVSGKCILMYATPVRGFHNWHRGFVRLFGKL
jgi:uncharacterized protein